MAALIGLFILLDLLFGLSIASPGPALFGFCFFAPVYLYQISLAVIWLETDRFRVDAQRLVRDVAISIFFSTVVFANFYWHVGIIPTFADLDPQVPTTVSPADTFYFSVVTFTTLGFGDFRPSEGARLMAAFQAMLGTIHIGLIVGAVYIAVGQRR